MTDATTARSMSMWSLIDAALLGLELSLAAPDAEPRRRDHHHDRERHDFGLPDIPFDILFDFELFSMIGVRRPPCASPAALHATGCVLSARVCLHRGGQGEDYDHPWQRPRRGRRRGPRRAATDRLQVLHCTCAGAAEEPLELLERRHRRRGGQWLTDQLWWVVRGLCGARAGWVAAGGSVRARGGETHVCSC